MRRNNREITDRELLESILADAEGLFLCPEPTVNGTAVVRAEIDSMTGKKTGN